MGGMEAALVSGILKIVGDKLAPLVIEEFSSVMGVTKDLRELQDLVEEIKSWLRAVGDRSIENQPSFHWLKGLKDVAYDVEDLVDEFHLEAEKHEVYAAGDKHIVAKYLSAKQKSVLFRRKMAHKIKTIREKFHAIVKNRSDVSTIVNNLPVDPVQDTNMTIWELPLWENVGESYIRVRDMEKCDIISKLVEINDGEKIQIISIVGLGGTGKTTLAKHICQDNKTKGHFESTFLVHVSRDFDVVKLIEKLFEAVVDAKSERNTPQHMSRVISEKLSGRKFLLVLDDVWNGDQHDWEQFMVHINNGASGSRILLTTRDQKVAEALRSTWIFNLSFLSENDSWKLFQQSLGWAEQDLLDSEFTQVGKEIVMKCGGVPLAIKVLAGVLRQKRRINAWQAIRESNLWNEQDIECRVFATLRLSYFHLPDQLKQCFTYCSIFPKGYEIYKDDLITQWIAQGFVNPTSEVEQPEDIGSDYFNSLLKVSFLQDPVEDYKGRLRCRMHDLVHDLTRHILQDEMVSVLENKTSDHTQRCRYLSLTSCTGKVDRKLFNKVRALYVSGANLTVDRPIKKGCCVRTVILERISANSLPHLISRFELLGYLKISEVNCEALPDALSHCWNLQALHVICCTRLVMLPEFIGNLKKLRILEVEGPSDLESLPQSIGDCRNLQRLHLIDCQKLTEIPDSIGKIENLKVLRIVDCWNLRHLPSESFGMLSGLQILDVSTCYSLQELPSSFPRCTLRRLELSRTRLTILPQCITLLSALEYIDLGYCEELVVLPKGIQSLKRLEVLNLQGCDKLRGLPAGFGQLTRLRWLGLFVIGGGGDDAGISDMEHLDMISGELEIRNIAYLKDEDDVEKAFLKRKDNIRELTLAWYPKWEGWASSEEEFDMEKDLAVLNGLEPPSQIEALEISGYRGLHLPRWMRKQSDSSYLTGMLSNEKKSPSQFPRLSKLTLGYLPNLTHLRGLVELISLETLELRAMPNLVELPESMRSLTSLQHLLIISCSGLGMLPQWLGEFRSLRSLEIGYCDALRQLPEEIGELRSLQSLEIHNLPALTCLPESMQRLTSLEHLNLIDCAALDDRSTRRLIAQFPIPLDFTRMKNIEDNGWSLPGAIGRVVGKLRFYLGNSSDSHKYKGTMKMLDLLDEKLKLLSEENLQRVNIDSEEEMAAWLRQVKEATSDAEELVKDMEAEAEAGESAISDVMAWFHSDSSNLLRMKYTIGKLVSVCAKGESILEVPNLDEDRLESVRNDSTSLSPDHAFVVGRDEEIAMILGMILDDACFVAATSLESRASADRLQISQKGWIIETLRNIDLSKPSQEAPEVGPYQKEMGSSVEYTRVCNNTDSKMWNPTIIPIVGMGGVGKTTLAQFIFNDKRVQKRFQGQSAWVYFTNNIRKEELMTQIFVSLQPQHKILSHVFNLNSLHIQLQSIVEGKRFLLVLDDVSDEIRAIWGDLRSVLIKGSPGSVVLVTTQLFSVASFVGTTTPIFLDSLQCDDLWKLFKHHAFASKQSTEALEPIGRKIADKLHGFPLAAVTIGALLRHYLDEVHWERLLESWWWNISNNSLGIHIISSLGICYCLLPAYLRQCLVYCSIFPRNYVFQKYELIQMWIANGFVELDNSTGPRRLEDVAGEWFDELVDKCFLQPTIWKVWYIMHDLVRDFIIALTSNEYHGVDYTLGDLPQSVRHLSIDMDNMNVPWTDYNIKQLRSVILFGGFRHTNSSRGYNTGDSILEGSYDTVDSISERSYDTTDNDTVDSFSVLSSDTIDNDPVDIILKRSCDTIGSILKSSTSLRLLNLSNMRANAATACIGDHLLEQDCVALFVKFITRHHMLPRLIHLRYLDFSYSGITELPESLCGLCNLQVLGLRGCRFTQLPRSMNSLVSLRHLHADADTVALIHGIGRLTKLQDLYEFRVKAEDGHTISELRDMRYIQGPLCISDLQRVANRTEAIQANLFRKDYVTCLDLKWDKDQSSRGKYEGQKEPLQANLLEKNYTPLDISGWMVNPSAVTTPALAMEILESLSPPRNLQKLKIFGYPGFSFPDWVEQLWYVQVIEISHCRELQVLPPVGQLDHLRKLKLHELPSIKDVSSDVYGTSDVVFRSLEEVSFESMMKWEYWEDAGDREFFSNLQKLRIERCYNLRELPFMALGLSIKELHLSGCGSYAGTVSRYLQRLTCLTHLKVNDCSRKLTLPCHHLISLEYLHLSNCKELCFEGGILCLNNLKNLHISSCQKIASAQKEQFQHNKEHIHVMHSLTDLTMDNLSLSLNLSNILCKLPALETLCLYKNEIPKISLVQEQWLEQIKSLQELEFSCCYLLMQLPSNLATLSSLKKLTLQSCSQIHSLPSKGLPVNLKELQILGCSHILEARCQKEDGDTWVKKKIGEWREQKINEYRQKKTQGFCQGWLMYEEEWVKNAAEQLKNKEEWLMNEEEEWLKNNAEELKNKEYEWIKTMGKDWPKIAHIPYIRVNEDIIQNLYL